MSITTLRPYNDALIQLTARRSMRHLGRVLRPRRVQLLAAAVGLLLAAPITTFALELGEASIKSGIGQPLLVEIPYRLGADERLTSACVGLAPAVSAADALPTYTRVSRISITATHIEIFDNRGVREPLIGLNVDVHCSTAPHFVRSYQLFVDPPTQIPAMRSNSEQVAVARNPSATDAAAPVATRSAPTASTPITRTLRDPSPRARGQVGGDLTQGQTYRVVRGDTLSGIAARVAERPATILETADAIFAANPDAFSRGNRDLIKEGRSLTIPNLAPSRATLPAPSATPPLPAVREAELPTAAPVPTPVPTPAPTSATQPLSGGNAVSVVVAADAIETLPAVTTVVEASAPIPTATRDDLAPEESRGTTGLTPAWLTALLAFGGVILLSAYLAFVRRRKQQAAAQASGERRGVAIPRPRPVDPIAGIDVVESRLPRASGDDTTTSVRSSQIVPAANSDAASPAGLDDVVPTGPIESVDLDVGAPVVMNERVDWFAGRANASASTDATVSDQAIDENTATKQMPDLAAAATVVQQSLPCAPDPANRAAGDNDMTLTIVELDMLRQDHEAEHTLTQQASPALRDALADLKATKAARAATAATADTSTLESPQLPQSETDDTAAISSTTARARMK